MTQTLAELEAEFGKRRIVKIVIDDKIVASGQATLFNSTCQIGRMAVTPKLKGKGIGSTLLSELELSFREALGVLRLSCQSTLPNDAMEHQQKHIDEVVGRVQLFNTQQAGHGVISHKHERNQLCLHM